MKGIAATDTEWDFEIWRRRHKRRDLGAAHRDPELAARNLEGWIGKSLRDLRRLKVDTLLRRRYERLRKLGSFVSETPRPTTPRGRTRRTAAPASARE